MNIKDIADKLESAIGEEDWDIAKSALNDLWDWLEHNKMERDGVARMSAADREKWLDNIGKLECPSCKKMVYTIYDGECLECNENRILHIESTKKKAVKVIKHG